jgi:cell division septation protein DedD
MFGLSTAKNEKKAQRRNLSWQPDGRCESFTKKAILVSAPPTSGVYGLYSHDCQVFIGETENIQGALLRHERETDFTSRHLQPVGFTFESCAAEVRKSKADELIARFCPVLQTKAALDESQSNSATTSKGGLDTKKLETSVDGQGLSVHERKKRPKVRRNFLCKRTHGAVATSFVAGAVAIFYPGIPAVNDIQNQVYSAVGNPLAQILITKPTAANRTAIDSASRDESSINEAGGLAYQSAQTTPVKPNDHVSASTAESPLRFGAKNATREERPDIQTVSATEKTSPNVFFTNRGNLIKKWSVQVSAEPTKALADTLVQRLKDNGYDTYAVQAVVKGQTYYRVRVGHLDTREEAESVRQLLTRQGGYRNAYFTVD